MQALEEKRREHRARTCLSAHIQAGQEGEGGRYAALQPGVGHAQHLGWIHGQPKCAALRPTNIIHRRAGPFLLQAQVTPMVDVLPPRL